MGDVRWKSGSRDVSAVGSYVAGALPATTVDGLTFDDGVDTGPTTGPMTNANALAAVDLLYLRMLAETSVNLGSSADPFVCLLNNGGTSYFENLSKAKEVWLSGGGGVIYEVRWKPAAFCRMVLQSAVNSILRSLGGGGLIIVPGTTTVVDVEALGPGSVVLQQHASDVTGALAVSGGGLIETRRRIAAASTVGGGGRLVNDVDSTSASSTVTIDGGGAVDLIKGSLAINGKNGVLDCTRLAKTGYTISGTAYPGLTIKLGANRPTLSYTSISGGPSLIAA